MTCSKCGATTAPGSLQCGVCFAPLAAAQPSAAPTSAYPPATAAYPAGPMPGVSVPHAGYGGPAPVLPPRGKGASKPKGNGWGIAGYGGGFLGVLLILLRIGARSYYAYDRYEHRSPSGYAPADTGQISQGPMGMADRNLPAPTRPMNPGFPSGSATPFPSAPVPGRPPMGGFSAQGQQMRDQMAADQQRLRQQMDSMHQQMSQQASDSHQRMQQQMADMRNRVHGPAGGAFGPGYIGGMSGPPGFGGPMGPRQMGGPLGGPVGPGAAGGFPSGP